MSEGAGTAAYIHPPEGAGFAQLYRRYQRPVRDFCRRRRASHLVDDAVAETFLTAWRRLNDIPTGAEALVYAHRPRRRLDGARDPPDNRGLRREPGRSISGGAG